MTHLKPAKCFRKQLTSAFATAELPSQVHEIVMSGLLPEPGTYRTGQAMAAGSSRRYRMPGEIQCALLFAADAFSMQLHKTTTAREMDDCSVLVSVAFAAANYFQDFLLTHPFSDGNGRTARTLMCALLGQSFCGVPFTVLPFDGQRSTMITGLELSRKPIVSSVGLTSLTRMVLLGLCGALEAWVECVEDRTVRL